LFSTDESFFKVAEEGMPLAIESGRITARIKTVAQGIIRLQMERGGLIRNGAHIDLPFVELPLPFISEKDERGLRLAGEEILRGA
jgi:pyruvate kinase